MKNKIIILNGVSSAGKTSITKEFQEIADGCYYNLRMDRIHSFLPRKHTIYGDHKNADPNFENSLTEENKKGFYFNENLNFCKGEYALAIDEDYLDLIYMLAKKGRNIITDLLSLDKSHTTYMKNMFKEFDTYFIKVHCDIDELRRREIKRGDRTVGTAEKQQELLDKNDFEYDYVIDSTYKTSVELAKELNEFITYAICDKNLEE